MGKLAVAFLLLAALVLPVALFSLLWPRMHLNGFAAAAVAVAAGWVLNVAWAFAAQRGASTEPSPANASTLSIASRFGWACPAVLVLLTWLIWRFVA